MDLIRNFIAFLELEEDGPKKKKEIHSVLAYKRRIVPFIKGKYQVEYSYNNGHTWYIVFTAFPLFNEWVHQLDIFDSIDEAEEFCKLMNTADKMKEHVKIINTKYLNGKAKLEAEYQARVKARKIALEEANKRLSKDY